MKKGESTYILDPGQFDVSGPLEILAKDCGEILEKKYPGWWWCINPDEVGGIMYIYALRLSGEWGYTIKIADIQDDPKRAEALMAGGEILERYSLPRGPYKRELLLTKMKDLRGNFIPDITDRHSKAQKKQRDRDFSAAVRENKARVVRRDTVKEDGTVFREIAVQIGDPT